MAFKHLGGNLSGNLYRRECGAFNYNSTRNIRRRVVRAVYSGKRSLLQRKVVKAGFSTRFELAWVQQIVYYSKLKIKDYAMLFISDLVMLIKNVRLYNGILILLYEMNRSKQKLISLYLCDAR